MRRLRQRGEPDAWLALVNRVHGMNRQPLVDTVTLNPSVKENSSMKSKPVVVAKSKSKNPNAVAPGATANGISAAHLAELKAAASTAKPVAKMTAANILPPRLVGKAGDNSPATRLRNQAKERAVQAAEHARTAANLAPAGIEAAKSAPAAAPRVKGPNVPCAKCGRDNRRPVETANCRNVAACLARVAKATAPKAEPAAAALASQTPRPKRAKK